MNKLRIKTLSILLIFALIAGVFVPAQKTQAAGVSSKSFVITIKSSKNYINRFKFKYKLSGKSSAVAEVKILDVKWKANSSDDEWGISWGYFEDDMGKGSLFYNLKPKDFKKGSVLTSSNDITLCGNGEAEIDLPDGIKKLKIKVTFKTTDNSKSITEIKKEKAKLETY